MSHATFAGAELCRRAVSAALLVLTLGCNSGNEVVGRSAGQSPANRDGGAVDLPPLQPPVTPPADGIAGQGGAASAPGGGAGSTGLSGTREEYCNGRGAVIALPGNAGPTCTGDVATKTFRFAICSCTDFRQAGDVATDSFDSQTKKSGLNGAVGANGVVGSSSGMFNIGGALWAGGASAQAASGAIQLTGNFSVAGQVQSGRGFLGVGRGTIAGDLVSNGPVTGSGEISVGGATRVPAGTAVTGLTSQGGVVNGPVMVQEPCNCRSPLDIAGIVKRFETQNDNATAKLEANALDGVSERTIDLPCGRFFLTKIQAIGLKLRLAGRTALFVAGDVNVTGPFDIELAPGAELDLFATGDLTFTGQARFGSTAEPARIRVYAAGDQIGLAGGMTLGANIYAPAATVLAAADLEVSGALFANAFQTAGSLKVHYDEAIQKVEGCEAPGRPCSSCNDCGGAQSACRNGVCGACVTNSDCCAPLACQNGQCVKNRLIQ